MAYGLVPAVADATVALGGLRRTVAAAVLSRGRAAVLTLTVVAGVAVFGAVADAVAALTRGAAIGAASILVFTALRLADVVAAEAGDAAVDRARDRILFAVRVT